MVPFVDIGPAGRPGRRCRPAIAWRLTTLAALLLAAAVFAGCQGRDDTWTPDPSLSTLVAAPASLPADGAAASTLTATVRNRHGGPLSGVKVTFAASSSGIRLSAAEAVTGPDGVASVSAASSTVGSSTMSATAAGVTLAQTPSVEFFAWADPSRSSLIATPTALPADGAATSILTATIRDWQGAPLAGVRVTFSASGGIQFSATEATTGADGVATVSVTSLTAGTGIISATAAGVTLAQTPSVEFLAWPDPSRSSLIATPTALPADGAATSILTATIRDWQGAPLAGVRVTFSASGGGSLLSATDAGRRVFTARRAGAPGVGPGTIFSWTRPAGQVSGIMIRCASAQLELVTAAESLTLPDLGVLGHAWPPGAACSWMVGASNFAADVDGYATSPSTRVGLELSSTAGATITFR